jgi:two-component system response regulator LytT
LSTSSRLQVLVVEDEWPARNYLVELLQASKLADVVGAVPSVEEAREAFEAPEGAAIDAAFVDVQLGGEDRAGLDLVKAIAHSRPGLSLVLATAFEQHALEAYQLGVVDYLLKPFSQERVGQCLDRVIGRRAPAAAVGPARIVARRKRNLVFLDPAQIWAFEAVDRLTFVHTEQGRFDLDLSLTAIEVSLGRTLTRVHRSWLVNASFIRELQRDGSETTLFVGTALDGKGLTVPVSRDRAQAVKEMLLSNATGLRRT